MTEPLEVLDAACPYVLAALQQESEPIRIATVCRTERAKQLWMDLSAWKRQTPGRIYYFAEPDPLIYE